MLRIKRIYEPASKDDGYRVLVDRLWPRGMKKEEVHIDKWLKEIAPSNDLRKWFGHEPEKWEQFIAKYRTEIKNSQALEELKNDMLHHKIITLLFSAKDEQHNQALALQKIIMKEDLKK